MPKAVKLELWPEDAKPEEYALMRDLIDAHHPDLKQTKEFEGARIVLGCKFDVKRSKDGNLELACVKKVDEIGKQLAAKRYDLAILVNWEVWKDENLPLEMRRAIIDHELKHIVRDRDAGDKPVVDDLDRPVWRLRKHDVGEFRDVIKWHGPYMEPLQEFADALLEARDKPLLNRMRDLTGETKERAKGKQKPRQTRQKASA